MVERIKELMIAQHLTATKFAETIGVQRSAVSHVLSGRNNPSLDFILKLKQAFPILNLDYILLGEGKLMEEVSPGSSLSEAWKPDKRTDLFQGEIAFEKSRDTPEDVFPVEAERKTVDAPTEKVVDVPENWMLSEREGDQKGAGSKPGLDKPKQIIFIYEDDTYKLIRPR